MLETRRINGICTYIYGEKSHAVSCLDFQVNEEREIMWRDGVYIYIYIYLYKVLYSAHLYNGHMYNLLYVTAIIS